MNNENNTGFNPNPNINPGVNPIPTPTPQPNVVPNVQPNVGPVNPATVGVPTNNGVPVESGVTPNQNDVVGPQINPMDQVVMPTSTEENTQGTVSPTVGQPAVGSVPLNQPAGNLQQPVNVNVNVTPQPQALQQQPVMQQPTGYTAQPNMGVNQPSMNMNPNSAPQRVDLGIPVQPVAFENPNNIGTMPPVNNNTQPTGTPVKKGGKKPMNKTLFVVLLIVLLLAVGGGVYWYLNMPKTASIIITPKEVTYGINDEVSTKIEDYATITGTNASNCTLDTSQIDTSKFGDYSFTIKCGNTTKVGVAKVADSDNPVVSLVTVYKKVNEEITPTEFIGVCFDSSKCTYEFENSEEAKTLTSTVGNDKTVKIIVKDENNNSTTVDGKLNVIENSIKTYRTCSSKEQNLTDFNAVMTSSQRFAFSDQLSSDGSYSFANFGTQTYTFKFTDQKEFDELLAKMKSDNKVTINNVSGIAEFNKTDMTVKIVEDLNISNLTTQYTQEKLLSYKTIDQLYVTELGYTCVNK